MPFLNEKFMFQHVRVTACLIQYLNELVWSENCFACVTDIAISLCLAWTKLILLFSFYACSDVYILLYKKNCIQSMLYKPTLKNSKN